jgi:glycosyltransferase involved in cell wall biosynthesis
VVTTPVGQVSELVEGCGVLVPADDPEALADGLHRLLGDPAMVAELGRAGRARVRERYSAERVARQVEREWRLLLGATDGPPAAVRGGRRPAR